MNANTPNTLTKPCRLALIPCLPLTIGVSACDHRNGALPERQRTAGKAIDDKTLSTSVRDALSADTVKYPDIQVAAYRGIVQLSGFAHSREHKERANDIAKNVVGVRKVENNVSLKEERNP